MPKKNAQRSPFPSDRLQQEAPAASAAGAFSVPGGQGTVSHCLPADISNLSCGEGEADSTVFNRYLTSLSKQASFTPYIIATMILREKDKDPAAALPDTENSGPRRHMKYLIGTGI